MTEGLLRSFLPAIGNGILRLSDLEEVVLDVEVTINNRPLSYLAKFVASG